MTTIFLRGTLSRIGADRAARTIADLPQKVRNIHLDLARLRLFDVDALESTLQCVQQWATERDGCVSVTPPIRV